MGREIHARETRFGRYYEEFELGDVYHHWPGKTITEADDHLFCMITMNHHPLHTDAHYAETETQFRRNVVVGNLVYSLVLGMSVPDISGKAIANLEIESLATRARRSTATRSTRARRCSTSASRRASPTAASSRSRPSAGTSATRPCASSGGACSCRGARLPRSGGPQSRPIELPGNPRSTASRAALLAQTGSASRERPRGLTPSLTPSELPSLGVSQIAYPPLRGSAVVPTSARSWVA